MITITAVFSRIVSTIYRSESEPDASGSGAVEVRDAINEFGAMAEGIVNGTLGEPYMMAGKGQYFTDPKVVVPVSNVQFTEETELIFDVPQGYDDDNAAFVDLLEVYDLDIESMEYLEGEQVPVVFVDGNPMVAWPEISGEEVDEIDEEIEEDADESSVNVEETTFSAGGEGDRDE